MKQWRLREGSGVLSFSLGLMQGATPVSRELLKICLFRNSAGCHCFRIFFFFASSASADFIRNCWSGGRGNILYNEIKPRDHPCFLSVTWVEGPPLVLELQFMLGLEIEQTYGGTGKAPATLHVFFSGKTGCLPASPSLAPVCLSKNSSIKVKPTPTFTLGIKDKTKQVPKTWPTGTLQPNRLPKADMKPMSQLALPVAKE